MQGWGIGPYQLTERAEGWVHLQNSLGKLLSLGHMLLLLGWGLDEPGNPFLAPVPHTCQWALRCLHAVGPACSI